MSPTLQYNGNLCLSRLVGTTSVENSSENRLDLSKQMYFATNPDLLCDCLTNT